VNFKNQSHLRNLSWLPQIGNGCDDITEILLKMALNTITLPNESVIQYNI
jgi:hypothetical protein